MEIDMGAEFAVLAEDANEWAALTEAAAAEAWASTCDALAAMARQRREVEAEGRQIVLH